MSDAFRTHDGRTLQQAASDLVAREVLCCMSSMVSTLANSANSLPHDVRELNNLVDRAFELAAPVLDYEGAAREAGWERNADGTYSHIGDDGEEPAESAEFACLASHREPRELEVHEHWAVSTWLAEKLQAAGERVDTDFAGLNVWARTTTGQAISIDAVIEQIAREMHAQSADAAN